MHWINSNINSFSLGTKYTSFGLHGTDMTEILSIIINFRLVSTQSYILKSISQQMDEPQISHSKIRRVDNVEKHLFKLWPLEIWWSWQWRLSLLTLTLLLLLLLLLIILLLLFTVQCSLSYYHNKCRHVRLAFRKSKRLVRLRTLVIQFSCTNTFDNIDNTHVILSVYHHHNKQLLIETQVTLKNEACSSSTFHSSLSYPQLTGVVLTLGVR